MKEAMFYTPLPEGEVRCNLCKHRCKIKEGKRGYLQCEGKPRRKALQPRIGQRAR